MGVIASVQSSEMLVSEPHIFPANPGVTELPLLCGTCGGISPFNVQMKLLGAGCVPGSRISKGALGALCREGQCSGLSHFPSGL